MDLLAFDTSTEVMSIAVQRTDADQVQLWQHTAEGGAQSSKNMIPEILLLMLQAKLSFDQLDAVVFGSGPGSFTGLRTSCSMAQGLAFGADLCVLPIPTLWAVAEEARWQLGATQTFSVTALLDARMGEIYAESYTFDSGIWACIKGCSLIRPQDVIGNDGALAGNVFAQYGSYWPQAQQQIFALPTAAALLRLAPALLKAGAAVPADQALPIYVRDKVAQTMQERNDAKPQ